MITYSFPASSNSLPVPQSIKPSHQDGEKAEDPETAGHFGESPEVQNNQPSEDVQDHHANAWLKSNDDISAKQKIESSLRSCVLLAPDADDPFMENEVFQRGSSPEINATKFSESFKPQLSENYIQRIKEATKGYDATVTALTATATNAACCFTGVPPGILYGTWSLINCIGLGLRGVSDFGATGFALTAFPKFADQQGTSKGHFDAERDLKTAGRNFMHYVAALWTVQRLKEIPDGNLSSSEKKDLKNRIAALNKTAGQLEGKFPNLKDAASKAQRTGVGHVRDSHVAYGNTVISLAEIIRKTISGAIDPTVTPTVLSSIGTGVSTVSGMLNYTQGLMELHDFNRESEGLNNSEKQDKAWLIMHMQNSTIAQLINYRARYRELNRTINNSLRAAGIGRTAWGAVGIAGGVLGATFAAIAAAPATLGVSIAVGVLGAAYLAFTSARIESKRREENEQAKMARRELNNVARLSQHKDGVPLLMNGEEDHDTLRMVQAVLSDLRGNDEGRKQTIESALRAMGVSDTTIAGIKEAENEASALRQHTQPLLEALGANVTTGRGHKQYLDHWKKNGNINEKWDAFFAEKLKQSENTSTPEKNTSTPKQRAWMQKVQILKWPDGSPSRLTLHEFSRKEIISLWKDEVFREFAVNACKADMESKRWKEIKSLEKTIGLHDVYSQNSHLSLYGVLKYHETENKWHDEEIKGIQKVEQWMQRVDIPAIQKCLSSKNRSIETVTRQNALKDLLKKLLPPENRNNSQAASQDPIQHFLSKAPEDARATILSALPFDVTTIKSWMEHYKSGNKDVQNVLVSRLDGLRQNGEIPQDVKDICLEKFPELKNKSINEWPHWQRKKAIPYYIGQLDKFLTLSHKLSGQPLEKVILTLQAYPTDGSFSPAMSRFVAIQELKMCLGQTENAEKKQQQFEEYIEFARKVADNGKLHKRPFKGAVTGGFLGMWGYAPNRNGRVLIELFNHLLDGTPIRGTENLSKELLKKKGVLDLAPNAWLEAKGFRSHQSAAGQQYEYYESMPKLEACLAKKTPSAMEQLEKMVSAARRICDDPKATVEDYMSYLRMVALQRKYVPEHKNPGREKAHNFGSHLNEQTIGFYLKAIMAPRKGSREKNEKAVAFEIAARIQQLMEPVCPPNPHGSVCPPNPHWSKSFLNNAHRDDAAMSREYDGRKNALKLIDEMRKNHVSKSAKDVIASIGEKKPMGQQWLEKAFSEKGISKNEAALFIKKWNDREGKIPGVTPTKRFFNHLYDHIMTATRRNMENQFANSAVLVKDDTRVELHSTAAENKKNSLDNSTDGEVEQATIILEDILLKRPDTHSQSNNSSDGEEDQDTVIFDAPFTKPHLQEAENILRETNESIWEPRITHLTSGKDDYAVEALKVLFEGTNDAKKIWARNQLVKIRSSINLHAENHGSQSYKSQLDKKIRGILNTPLKKQGLDTVADGNCLLHAWQGECETQREYMCTSPLLNSWRSLLAKELKDRWEDPLNGLPAYVEFALADYHWNKKGSVFSELGKTEKETAFASFVEECKQNKSHLWVGLVPILAKVLKQPVLVYRDPYTIQPEEAWLHTNGWAYFNEDGTYVPQPVHTATAIWFDHVHDHFERVEPPALPLHRESYRLHDEPEQAPDAVVSP